MKPEENPPDTPEAPPARSRFPAVLRRVLAILPRVGVFAGLAAGAFAVALFVVRPLFPPVQGAAPARPAQPVKFGRVVGLEPVIVNVAQTEGRRYLKATVQLEAPDEEKAVKELEARKPQLVDLLIATLAKKSLGEVTAPDAIERLRGEVHQRLSQEVGRERVRRVFITEFVVQ